MSFRVYLVFIDNREVIRGVEYHWPYGNYSVLILASSPQEASSLAHKQEKMPVGRVISTDQVLTKSLIRRVKELKKEGFTKAQILDTTGALPCIVDRALKTK